MHTYTYIISPACRAQRNIRFKYAYTHTYSHIHTRAHTSYHLHASPKGTRPHIGPMCFAYISWLPSFSKNATRLYNVCMCVCVCIDIYMRIYTRTQIRCVHTSIVCCKCVICMYVTCMYFANVSWLSSGFVCVCVSICMY